MGVFFMMLSENADEELVKAVVPKVRGETPRALRAQHS